MVGFAEVFSNLLNMLLTSNLLFVTKSFCLGLVSRVFFNFSRKTFFSWGSGTELIASNKRSCSLVRVLIFLSSSSVDDGWSSCWVMLRFSSENVEEEVYVSSSEVSMSKLLICSSMAGSRLRFLNFLFNLQYLLNVALFSTVVTCYFWFRSFSFFAGRRFMRVSPSWKSLFIGSFIFIGFFPKVLFFLLFWTGW